MLKERRSMTKIFDDFAYTIVFEDGTPTKIRFNTHYFTRAEVTIQELGNILSLINSLSTHDYNEVASIIRYECGIEMDLSTPKREV